MFVATGVGPFSGQAVHFKHFALEKVPYAHQRYQYEAERHYRVANAHLASRAYMVGDAYSIVDMDLWGWARMIPFILGDDAWAKFPNLKRLFDEISERPAAQRAVAFENSFHLEERSRRRGSPAFVQTHLSGVTAPSFRFLPRQGQARMHGPFQKGHFAGQLEERRKSFKHLAAGRRYRVVQAFRDYDRGLHIGGETWIFLGYSFLPYDDGLSLFVSLDGDREWAIRMQWRPEEQEEIINSLADFISETPS